ncbi:L-idonate 5-dehydrogenase [Gallibacterium genomosp. 3]|uniref:L-idonate 5-dehydrogenase n=1 Tax=Gallibacterium genomosp. 3 TaxID=505345 RepID=A0A1A7NLT4_9PAST|nr:L-idonate 5-dehydrogenase [Gallibacterium genomosp. 3]OBW90615.1 L-idonate 5-dehydrogenase [Gallibacterium genomosp. 3]
MNSHTIKTKACVIYGAKDIHIEEQDLLFTDDDVIVKIEFGGICGSDIHYYHEGRAGLSVIKHPMIIGHEFAGIVYYAPKNSSLKIGQYVAVNPSQPCQQCEFCLQGKQNHCKTMRFMGSAQYNPHVQGGFSQYVKVSESQCYLHKTTSKIMAFAEPLSVAIHAVNVAGNVVGKKVLVTGAGPIGCLISAAAKSAGASEVIVSDLTESSRSLALKMGADKVIDAKDKEIFTDLSANKGYFDVVFEASGAMPAIISSVQVTKPKGSIIQVGMGVNLSQYPVDQLIAKEISWKGSFRFIDEFRTAVDWLEQGIIDPLPLVTSSYSIEQAEEALIVAADKNVSSKVQINFA